MIPCMQTNTKGELMNMSGVGGNKQAAITERHRDLVMCI